MEIKKSSPAAVPTSPVEGQAETERKPSGEIGPLIRRFFQALDERPVPWAVLRGGDGLPDWTRYDIDLLLRPEDLDPAEEELRWAGHAVGWTVVRIVDKWRYRCCLAIGPGPSPRFLPIDLFGGCYHRFHPIADSEYGLQSRQRNDRGVALVPPGFGAGVSLLKELSRHPVFKENSRAEVTRGALDDPESFKRGLWGVLGNNLTEQLLAASQAGDWDQVAKLVPALRRQVSGAGRRWTLKAGGFFLGNLRHHLRPPMSALVVLLGPDGSGKSTIADLVAEKLRQKPFKVCPRYEYQFRILPELKQIKRGVARLMGKRLPPTRVLEPGTHGSGMNPDHGNLTGMIYVTYYAVDFFLGRLLLRKLRGQGGLILFARYFYDYYFQRGYGNVPRQYLKLLEWLVPKPDLILYLDRDAGEIHRGKPELEVEEIRRQQAVIRNLMEGRSNAAIVDASGGVEPTVREVADRIIGILLERWRK